MSKIGVCARGNIDLGAMRGVGGESKVLSGNGESAFGSGVDSKAEVARIGDVTTDGERGRISSIDSGVGVLGGIFSAIDKKGEREGAEEDQQEGG